MLVLAALACLSWVSQEPTVEELRAAYDALRDGQPGEAKFEAALPRLPDLLASRSSTFVEGAAYVAGELGRSECVEALVDALRHENVGTGERSVGPTRCLLD